MNIKLATTIIIFFVILLIAQITVWGVKRRYPEQNWASLDLRMKSWWVVALVFAIVIISSKITSLILLGFISFLALKDFLTFLPTRFSDNHAILVAYFCIPIQYYWVGAHWFSLFVTFIPIYLFVLLPIVMLLNGDTKGFLKSAAHLHWGMMITVFSVSHIAYLDTLQYNHVHIGPQLVVYLFVLTECYDLAQYLWNRLAGKRPVLSNIAYKKTLEGVVGGVASTIVVAMVLAPILTPLTIVHSFCIGVLVAIFSLVGGIVIHAIRQDMGIKGSVQLLPGHGGVLDRLNSLIFTAPIFFHFIYYFYY